MNVILPWAFTSPTELWPILVIAVVLFGAKKLPELARGMGEGMREFKKAIKDVNADDDATMTMPAATAPAQVTQAAAPDSPEDVEKRIIH